MGGFFGDEEGVEIVLQGWFGCVWKEGFFAEEGEGFGGFGLGKV